MYEITRSYSRHTGGSKFYQTVRIQREDGKGAAVAIFHYDAIRGGDYPHIPDNGKTELKLCRNVNEAGRVVSSKISEKMKTKAGGSYSKWDSKEIYAASDRALADKLCTMMDKTLCIQILVHMGAPLDALNEESISDAVSEDLPSAEVDTVIVDEPKSPIWGTW